MVIIHFARWCWKRRVWRKTNRCLGTWILAGIFCRSYFGLSNPWYRRSIDIAARQFEFVERFPAHAAFARRGRCSRSNLTPMASEARLCPESCFAPLGLVTARYKSATDRKILQIVINGVKQLAKKSTEGLNFEAIKTKITDTFFQVNFIFIL